MLAEGKGTLPGLGRYDRHGGPRAGGPGSQTIHFYLTVPFVVTHRGRRGAPVRGRTRRVPARGRSERAHDIRQHPNCVSSDWAPSRGRGAGCWGPSPEGHSSSELDTPKVSRLTAEDPALLQHAIASSPDPLSVLVWTVQRLVPPAFTSPEPGKRG
ncbi:uncharacterized protein LOC144229430 [Crocuta crocuta]